MLSPQEWIRYCRSTPELLPTRRQTRAFVGAYGLHPLPLLAHSKIAFTGPPPNFNAWADIDAPDQINWSAAIPVTMPTVAWVDIDFDTRTLSSSTEWTEATLEEARSYQRILARAFDTFEVGCHRFGRDSLDNLGHALLPVAIDNASGLRQSPLELLDMLNMRRKVRVGDIMLGIEVRRPSPGRQRKVPMSITLPGSTYRPGLGQPTDLIRWKKEADFEDGAVWDQKLAPRPLHALRMAIYAAILAMGVIHYWSKGDRHAMGLAVAGALAHEHSVGFLSNDAAGSNDAERVFEFILNVTNDPDAKDRRKAFSDTMRAMEAGRPVTGYRTLREAIDNNDLVNALLAIRGGSDPDAISNMFKNAVYIEKEDKWLWLPEEHHEPLFLRNHAEFRNFLRYHPAYPPQPRAGKAGPIHVVDIVMNSDRKQRVGSTISFPGVDFGERYIRDGSEYIPIDPDGEAPERVDAINVSAGFATPAVKPGELPNAQAYERALFLWKRHRANLTKDDALQNRKLDQLIARKIQKPRKKYQLGCALTGGQGIGKSALFDMILKPVIGNALVNKSTGADMNSEFRYRQLDKSLFYYFEELKLSKADNETQESLKDLMRNSTVERNKKYGAQDTCRNVAIPFILSNDKHPTILVDGVPDRALVVIHGITQSGLGCTVDEWSAIKARIDEEAKEFAEALKDPNIRQGLFHYWDNIEIDERIFDDNEAVGVSPEDVIHTLSPRGRALIDMLASGNIFPGRDASAGPSIYEPFPYEAIAEGLVARTGKPASVRDVGVEFADLFMDDKMKTTGTRNDAINRDAREKMVRSCRFTPPAEKERRMYYLGLRPAEIGEWLKSHRNIELDFEFSLYPSEAGEVPKPENDVCLRSWKKWQAYVPMGRMPRGLGSP